MAEVSLKTKYQPSSSIPRLHFLFFHRGLCLLVFVSAILLPLNGDDQCIIAPVLTRVEREVMSGQTSVLDLHLLPKLKSVLWPCMTLAPILKS